MGSAWSWGSHLSGLTSAEMSPFWSPLGIDPRGEWPCALCLTSRPLWACSLLCHSWAHRDPRPVIPRRRAASGLECRRSAPICPSFLRSFWGAVTGDSAGGQGRAGLAFPPLGHRCGVGLECGGQTRHPRIPAEPGGEKQP